MFQYIVMFLLASTTSLFGNDTKGLIAGDVSPAPKSSVSTSNDDDSDDTGEVDDDIIITDEEDTDDDEGVQN